MYLNRIHTATFLPFIAYNTDNQLITDTKVESNQEDEFDKYNRVDMLAENSKGELILIEVQNNNEYAYFQRMLFGTSKLVTEYINRGEGYDKVRKVYSVNIVYFSLGSGKDTVYHGKTEFRGIHQGDMLELKTNF